MNTKTLLLAVMLMPSILFGFTNSFQDLKVAGDTTSHSITLDGISITNWSQVIVDSNYINALIYNFAQTGTVYNTINWSGSLGFSNAIIHSILGQPNTNNAPNTVTNVDLSPYLLLLNTNNFAPNSVTNVDLSPYLLLINTNNFAPNSITNVDLSPFQIKSLPNTNNLVPSDTNNLATKTFIQTQGFENSSNKSQNVLLDSTSTTKYPSVSAIKSYADNLIVGVLSYRGGYNASGNTFPTIGSATNGNVLAGNMWVISVSGTLGGQAVNVGDSIIAAVNLPGQVATNWDILEGNISYVPENQVNKITSLSPSSTDTQYPSARLLYVTVLNATAGVQYANSPNTNNASLSVTNFDVLTLTNYTIVGSDVNNATNWLGALTFSNFLFQTFLTGGQDYSIITNPPWLTSVPGNYATTNQLSNVGQYSPAATIIGYNALTNSSAYLDNTAFGYQSQIKNISGNYNTSIGYNSMYLNANGWENTAIGHAALSSNTNGNYNIGIGYQGGQYVRGSYNIIIGNSGTYSDSGIIRIGNSNNTNTFIAGVYSNSTVNGSLVIVDKSGQLGTSNIDLSGYDLYSNATNRESQFISNGQSNATLNGGVVATTNQIIGTNGLQLASLPNTNNASLNVTNVNLAPYDLYSSATNREGTLSNTLASATNSKLPTNGTAVTSAYATNSGSASFSVTGNYATQSLYAASSLFATNATYATSSGVATNATQLGSKPASQYVTNNGIIFNGTPLVNGSNTVTVGSAATNYVNAYQMMLDTTTDAARSLDRTAIQLFTTNSDAYALIGVTPTSVGATLRNQSGSSTSTSVLEFAYIPTVNSTNVWGSFTNASTTNLNVVAGAAPTLTTVSIFTNATALGWLRVRLLTNSTGVFTTNELTGILCK